MTSERVHRLKLLLKGLRKKPGHGNSYFDAEARQVTTFGFYFPGMDPAVGCYKVHSLAESGQKVLFLTATLPDDAETAEEITPWYLGSRGQLIRGLTTSQVDELVDGRVNFELELQVVNPGDLVDEEVLDQLIFNIRRQLSLAVTRKASEVATYAEVLNGDLVFSW